MKLLWKSVQNSGRRVRTCLVPFLSTLSDDVIGHRNHLVNNQRKIIRQRVINCLRAVIIIKYRAPEGGAPLAAYGGSGPPRGRGRPRGSSFIAARRPLLYAPSPFLTTTSLSVWDHTARLLLSPHRSSFRPTSSWPPTKLPIKFQWR